MFKALFYPRHVKFYTDNVRASVTNSMSGAGGLFFDSQYKLFKNGALESAGICCVVVISISKRFF